MMMAIWSLICIFRGGVDDFKIPETSIPGKAALSSENLKMNLPNYFIDCNWNAFQWFVIMLPEGEEGNCYLWREKRGFVTCEGGRGEGEDVAETREEEDGQRPQNFIMIHLWWWWSWKCFYDVSPVEERALYLALEYGVVVLEEKELSRQWSSIISVLEIWKLELHLDSVDGADGGALARWRRHLGGVFGDRWWGPSVVT